MTRNVKTIDLKGNNYAKVSERIKLFREDCPRGSITTEPTFHPDGKIVFKTHVVKDKSDEFSAEATGHAYSEASKDKDFEKLESISVGRALALLGYLATGEIATSEEMEEFKEYVEDKNAQEIAKAKNDIDACNTIEELRGLYQKYSSLGAEVQKYITERKNQITI